MKTLKLTRAESAAYAAGVRGFWRAMRKQPHSPLYDNCVTGQWSQIWYTNDDRGDPTVEHCEPLPCPYGTPGDRIELKRYVGCGVVTDTTITAITVEQRDGKWGWLVEVGA